MIESQQIPTEKPISKIDPRVFELTQSLIRLYFAMNVDRDGNCRSYVYEGQNIYELTLEKSISGISHAFKIVTEFDTTMGNKDEVIKHVVYNKSGVPEPDETIVLSYDASGVGVSSLGSSQPGETLQPFELHDYDVSFDIIERVGRIASGYLEAVYSQ